MSLIVAVLNMNRVATYFCATLRNETVPRNLTANLEIVMISDLTNECEALGQG